MQRNTVHTGDCFDVLSDLPAESVHAVVTDPPYGLAFMGRDWDDFEPKEYQEWCEKWATEVKRVLKPGGHLLAFSGNRTHHRLFTGVEDAGYEIRDTLTWHYGSGFPKASDISKTIDKRRGCEDERKVVDTDVQGSRNRATTHQYNTNNRESDDNGIFKEKDSHEYEITKAAHPDAKQWDGFKTGLKPATEYVVMARKPFDGATVDCVLEHGTGALNIDGTRIGKSRPPTGIRGDRFGEWNSQDGNERGESEIADTETDKGRYPSNVVFDETEAERLDREVGECKTGDIKPHKQKESSMYFNSDRVTETHNGDSGGPSRYFYTSKATKAERTLDGKIDNAHPTVKPQDLMEWLVKLVTAEEQTVLDPFAGSGTTLKAAKDLNRKFIGIEKQAQWADVARVRAGLTPNDPSHVRDTDNNQSGLEAYN